MPTEFCIECDLENQQAGDGVRAQHHRGSHIEFVASHRGRQCRFSRCARHCKCSRTEQREWIAYSRRVTPGILANVGHVPNITLFKCSGCSRKSTHACHYYHNDRRHRENPSGMMARRLCGMCCTSCTMLQTAAHGRGDELHCNNYSSITRDMRECTRCHRVSPSVHAYSNSECIWCRRLGSYSVHAYSNCATCMVFHYVPGYYSTEDSVRHLRLPVMERCNNCQRCVHGATQSTRGGCCICQVEVISNLQLHTCRVYTGFLNDVRTSRFNPVERTIGVEFELAGFRNPTRAALSRVYNTCVKWHAAIGTDGSIRGETGTSGQCVEIRTSPCGGTRYLLQLKELMAAFDKAGATVNTSCGMHVHVGLQDILQTPADIITGERQLYEHVERSARMPAVNHKLARIFGMWQVCEDMFYRFVPSERATGTYSKKWSAMHVQPLRSSSGRYIHSGNVLEDACRQGRYLGLNPTAIQKYGTVEYRLHHGCVDIKTVLPWTLLCSHFVTSALKHENLSDAMKWINEVGAGRYLYEIAPTEEVRQFVVSKLGTDAQPITSATQASFGKVLSNSKRSVKKRARKARYGRAA